MNKTILASILAVGFIGSAMATGGADVSSISVANTFAQAGNGGSSVSTAGNFAIGSGSTGSSSKWGSLSITGYDCLVPGAKATGYGYLTTVTGQANTMGGSYAKNVSTGNGTGSAQAFGDATSYVSAAKNGASGWAASETATLANAGKNQSRSAFASQDASFKAQSLEGFIVVTEPVTVGRGHHAYTYDKPVGAGVGTIATGTATVPKSTQVYSLSNQGCGHGGCQYGVGTANFVNYTGTGSYTLGQAGTSTVVTFGNDE